MSNILQKLFIESKITIPGYTVRQWVPAVIQVVTTVTGVARSGEIKVIVDNTSTGQTYTVGSYFSTYGDSGWTSYKITSVTYETITIPGYFINNNSPDTYYISYDPNTGWNSGARSIASALGDCTASFSVPESIGGAIVGLTDISDPYTGEFRKIDYSFVFTSGLLRLVDSQFPNLVAAGTYISSDIFTISRSGEDILYLKNGIVVHKSNNPSTTELTLDAILWTGGDSVIDASLTLLSDIEQRTATLANSSSELIATPKANAILVNSDSSIIFNGVYDDGTNLHSSNNVIISTSSIILNKDWGYSDLIGTSLLSGTGTNKTGINSSFNQMTASLTSGYFMYASINASFPAMTAELSGDVLRPEFVYIAASIEGLTANISSRVGGTTLSPSISYFGNMSALLSDHSFSEINTSFNNITVYAIDYPPDPRDIGNNAQIIEYFSGSVLLYYSQTNTIFENIISTTTTVSSTVTNTLINEYLQVVDKLLSTFSLSIIETVTFSSTLIGIVNQLEYIIENILLLDNAGTFSHLFNTISEIILLIESSTFGIKFTISETIGLQSTLSTLYRLFSIILENIVLSESNGSTYIHIVSLSDNLNIDFNTAHSTIFNNSLLDSFIISIPGVIGQETYLAYLLNSETNSVSTYTNYNFTCSTKFNDKYLFGNSSGLYEYGDKTDDGILIESRLKTIAYNLGTSNLKQIPEMYIGGLNSDKVIIKVNVDNRASVYYKVNNQIDNLHTQRIKFGKGLIGRYFQFELITSSTDLDIESLEFYPIVLKRKI